MKWGCEPIVDLRRLIDYYRLVPDQNNLAVDKFAIISLLVPQIL